LGSENPVLGRQILVPQQQFLVYRTGDVGQHARPNHLPTLSIFAVMEIGFYALLPVEEMMYAGENEEL
jgi:hypothetical protein